ncbi:hypothetical protein VTJ83DRAFT_1858 [Remersonia thermophila]|uniref:C2H2-type domain-containing protein n=1 Tax=Remersonia thermophila TaxID=72144 RepID=A0ABR4DI05_9PEZI
MATAPDPSIWDSIFRLSSSSEEPRRRVKGCLGVVGRAVGGRGSNRAIGQKALPGQSGAQPDQAGQDRRDYRQSKSSMSYKEPRTSLPCHYPLPPLLCLSKPARLLLAARDTCRCFPRLYASLNAGVSSGPRKDLLPPMAECDYGETAVSGWASGTVLSPPPYRAVCGRTRSASDSLGLAAALYDADTCPSSPHSDSYTIEPASGPLPADASQPRWTDNLAYRPRGAASFTSSGQSLARSPENHHPKHSGDGASGDGYDGPGGNGEEGQDGTDGGDSSNEDGHDEDGHDEDGDGSQKIPQQKPDLMCPFRSADSRYFNSRTHPACTRPFQTLSRVKEHLRTKHLIYACTRCWEDLKSQQDLEKHNSTRCEERPRPPHLAPEYGILAKDWNKFADTKRVTKLNSWGKLCGALGLNNKDTGAPPRMEYECPLSVEKVELKQAFQGIGKDVENDITRTLEPIHGKAAVEGIVHTVSKAYKDASARRLKGMQDTAEQDHKDYLTKKKESKEHQNRKTEPQKRAFSTMTEESRMARTRKKQRQRRSPSLHKSAPDGWALQHSLQPRSGPLASSSRPGTTHPFEEPGGVSIASTTNIYPPSFGDNLHLPSISQNEYHPGWQPLHEGLPIANRGPILCTPLQPNATSVYQYFEASSFAEPYQPLGFSLPAQPHTNYAGQQQQGDAPMPHFSQQPHHHGIYRESGDRAPEGPQSS